jgi:predicted acetyltransferase
VRRIRQIETDFAAYVAAITDQTGRIRLPTGDIVPKVPFSVFWLVEDDEFIGEANIRHQLNAYLIKEGGHVGYGIRPSRQRQGYGKLILALALEECRLLGLERVLVTCLHDNIASARIIEANGGELEDVVRHPAGRGRLRRYWISLWPRQAARPGPVASTLAVPGQSFFASPCGLVAYRALTSISHVGRFDRRISGSRVRPLRHRRSRRGGLARGGRPGRRGWRACSGRARDSRSRCIR